jgi:carbon storage regulator CsrA
LLTLTAHPGSRRLHRQHVTLTSSAPRARSADPSAWAWNVAGIIGLGIRNDLMWIGVAAPRSLHVHREEIYEQIARENAAAVEDVRGTTEALRAHPVRRPRQG